MEEELRQLLLGNAEISTMVNNNISFGLTHQGAKYPVIVLNTVSGTVRYNLGGSVRQRNYRVQVDCYALTYGEVKSLSRKVLDLLSGYKGGGFQGVFLIISRDIQASRSNEAESPFRVSLEFNITHLKEKTNE